MSLDLDNMPVVNNTEKERFEIELPDGDHAFLEYRISGKNIIYPHTEVPEAWESNGLAGKLAQHAMAYAKNEGLKVQALCPFVKSYVQRHKEYHDITWGF